MAMALAAGMAHTSHAGWEDVGAPAARGSSRTTPATVTVAPSQTAPRTTAAQPQRAVQQPATRTVQPQRTVQQPAAVQSGVPRTVREAAARRAAEREAQERAKAERQAAMLEAERRRIDAGSSYRAPAPRREEPAPRPQRGDSAKYRPDGNYGDAFFIPFIDASRESDGWLRTAYFMPATAPNGNDLKIAEAEARFLLTDVRGILGGDLAMALWLKGTGFIDDADYETLPYAFVEAAIDIGYVWRFVNDFSLELGARPGAYGDPENLDASLFGYPLRGALYYSFSPELAAKAGVEIRPGWDMAAMPLVGLGWAPSEYFRLEAALPRSLLLFHLGPFDIYGAAQWDNVTYAMEDKDDKPENMTIDDWRVYGGLTINFLDVFRVGAEAGYIMGREFKAEGSKGEGKIEIEDSPYFGVTLGSKF